MSKKTLNLCIDFGNESYKIIVNGVRFKVPYQITGFDARMLDSYDKSAGKEGYIKHHLLTPIPGEFQEYLVGKFAQGKIARDESILINKDSSDDMNKMKDENKKREDNGRYTNHIFKVGFEAVFGYAVVEYIKKHPEYRVEELAEYEINILGTYPHALVSEIGRDSALKIMGEHHYKLQVSDQEYEFNYTVNKVYYDSQAMCEFYSMVYNDEGDIDRYDILEMLPLLLLDGGYGTLGIVSFQKYGAIFKDDAESNTDYAMRAIHSAVADVFTRQYDRPQTHRTIAELIKSGEETIKVNKELQVIDGKEEYVNKIQHVNIKKIYEEKKDEFVKGLIEYLKKKFPNFLDYKGVFIGGGTGKEYYELFKGYTSEIFLPEEVILTAREFYGQEGNPVFAIAEGGFKILLNKLKRDNN